MTEQVRAFLIRRGMLDEGFSILACAEKMRDEMEAALQGGESSYPMIPTWLTAKTDVPENEAVVVIDAGGTNFRCGLVSFEDGECVEREVRKMTMPGVHEAATWDEFISFAADRIQDLLPETDRIGFCFSYTANITPEIDGRVICIDKEVEIQGSEGQLVGESLEKELERRGIHGKKAIVLNDTAAVQLGGIARHQKDGYRSFFGQVSGTGTNTCCTVPGERIGKLDGRAYDMIINMESGMYNGLGRGDFDRQLDQESHNPGQKRFEKMTAGAYMGELCRLTLRGAADDGLLSPACSEAVRALELVESFQADQWAAGENLAALEADRSDAEVISSIARYLFERSATLMCANLTGMALLTDAGRNEKAAVIAEGSLVQKNRVYRPMLEKLIRETMRESLGRDITLLVEEETTLEGTAAAALLNIA